MRKRLSQAIKHPLISGSVVISIGSLFANLLNYLFNLGMGRILSVSDYGVLAVLISIINIFSIFAQTVATVFSKFSASLAGQKKEELIGTLFKKGTLWVGVIGLVISGMIIIFSFGISRFLHIEGRILIDIIAFILFFSFLSTVAYGILQGLLRFIAYSVLNILASFLKLALGLGFVLLGFRTLGAVWAIFLSTLFGYLLVFFPLSNFIKKKESNLSIPNLYRRLSLYGFPVFLSSVGMTTFISIDIILVKHFFEPTMAGQYAALSLMGRSIFYIVSPITLVLFPLVAQKREKRENLLGTILLSVFLTGVPSLVLSIIYFLLPRLVLAIFFPAKEYAFLAPYLGPFSIFILFFALCSLFNSFYLSIGKTRVFIFTTSGAFLEVLFIAFFHQSISQIITGLSSISFLLLLSLLLYYPHATKTS